jgi:hypothetical protein
MTNHETSIWTGPFVENEVIVWDENGPRLTTREECPHLQDGDPNWIPADTPYYEKKAWMQGLEDESQASGAASEDAPVVGLVTPEAQPGTSGWFTGKYRRCAS